MPCNSSSVFPQRTAEKTLSSTFGLEATATNANPHVLLEPCHAERHPTTGVDGSDDSEESGDQVPKIKAEA